MQWYLTSVMETLSLYNNVQDLHIGKSFIKNTGTWYDQCCKKKKHERRRLGWASFLLIWTNKLTCILAGLLWCDILWIIWFCLFFYSNKIIAWSPVLTFYFHSGCSIPHCSSLLAPNIHDTLYPVKSIKPQYFRKLATHGHLLQLLVY